MGVLFVLGIFCFHTVYLTIGTAALTLPLDQALDSPGSLTTISLNVSNPAVREHCTSSLIWTGGTGYDHSFTNDCFHAWRNFLTTDYSKYKNIDYEFLQQGVTPSHLGVPKMATPRRYVMDSCTIAVVNMADIPRGILPIEPPGPFPRSDLAQFADFRGPILAVKGECLGRRKKLGWAPTGKQQAMAIMMFSTNAPIDRIVPRGVRPPSPDFLNATTGAVDELDTAT